MSEELQSRVRSLEQSAAWLRGAAAVLGLVGLGVGAISGWALSVAKDAANLQDKKPQLIEEFVSGAKTRLAWEPVPTGKNNDFESGCEYRFAFRYSNRDSAVVYAVEVTGKTLSGAITHDRFFNVGAGSKGNVQIIGSSGGKFDVNWMEMRCFPSLDS